MPECLDAEEEFGDEVVVVPQELGLIVEEELGGLKRIKKREKGRFDARVEKGTHRIPVDRPNSLFLAPFTPHLRHLKFTQKAHLPVRTLPLHDILWSVGRHQARAGHRPDLRE